MILWTPIDQIPEALKDGRPVLLWIEGRPLTASWDRDRWDLIEGGEYAASLAVYGVITHFAEINPPEAEWSILGMPVVSAPEFFGMGLVLDGDLPADVAEIRDQRTGVLLARIESIGRRE